MTQLLTHFFNAMLHLEWRPPALKRGIIIPIPKGNKDCTIPSNNRGITLMPTLGKLYDSTLLLRADHWFQVNLDGQQGANRPRVSCLETALVLHETIAYNTSRDSTVYVGFMDVKKAFDSVWLDGLFVKLHDKGFDKKLWWVLRDAYADFQCCVAVAGGLSEWFVPRQGVHQGDVFSMRLHSFFFNALLTELKEQCRGARIGSIVVPSPTFADDLTVVALTKAALNHLFGVANRYSNRWRFVFSAEKTLAMVFGDDIDPGIDITLGGQKVTVVDGCTHVGIPVTCNRTAERRLVEEKVAACRRSFYSICGLSNAETPLPPLTASRLYLSICVPRLAYGAEIWSPLPDSLDKMEKIHGDIGKMIQGLSPAACTPARYSLLGWKPIEAIFDICKLLYLWRLLSLPCWSLYNKVAINRLTACRFSTREESGPIALIYSLAQKYGLLNIVHQMLDSGNLPTRTAWRNQVVKLVTRRYFQIWKMKTMMYRTLDYVLCAVGDVHHRPNVWWMVCRMNPRVTKQCKLVVRLMCGDHSLNAGRGRFTANTTRCCICDSYQVETLEHTLFVCDALNQVRSDRWEETMSVLPAGMKETVMGMTTSQRTNFVVTGCHGTYTREWQDIYETLAKFIYTMYITRGHIAGALQYL